MEEFELDYDVQEVRLSKEHAFKVTTVANEALPLEMLLDLETRRCVQLLPIADHAALLHFYPFNATRPATRPARRS